MDTGRRPRLCHLVKWKNYDGYGFNLHAEKRKTGHYIGRVEDGSPAAQAGLLEGDRLIEVNGTSVVNYTHAQVVNAIKQEPDETKLLVVDPLTDQYFEEEGIPINGQLRNILNIRGDHPLVNSDYYGETPRERTVSIRTPSMDETNNPTSGGSVINSSVAFAASNNVANTSSKSPQPSVKRTPSIASSTFSSKPDANRPPANLVHIVLKPSRDYEGYGFDLHNFGRSTGSSRGPSISASSTPAPGSPALSSTPNQQTNDGNESANTEDFFIPPQRYINILDDASLPVDEQHSEPIPYKGSYFIGQVDLDSPAQKAGLKPRDILYSVNGRMVKDLKHTQVVHLIKTDPDKAELIVARLVGSNSPTPILPANNITNATKSKNVTNINNIDLPVKKINNINNNNATFDTPTNSSKSNTNINNNNIITNKNLDSSPVSTAKYTDGKLVGIIKSTPSSAITHTTTSDSTPIPKEINTTASFDSSKVSPRSIDTTGKTDNKTLISTKSSPVASKESKTKSADLPPSSPKVSEKKPLTTTPSLQTPISTSISHHSSPITTTVVSSNIKSDNKTTPSPKKSSLTTLNNFLNLKALKPKKSSTTSSQQKSPEKSEDTAASNTIISGDNNPKTNKIETSSKTETSSPSNIPKNISTITAFQTSSTSPTKMNPHKPVLESVPDPCSKLPVVKLCHLNKWPDFQGYGFNLHAAKTEVLSADAQFTETGIGHFIGKVDDNSPAQAANLCEGDRLIEVNGKNIARIDHKTVVEMIKSDPDHACLLLVAQPDYQYFVNRKQLITPRWDNVQEYFSGTHLSSPRAFRHLKKDDVNMNMENRPTMVSSAPTCTSGDTNHQSFGMMSAPHGSLPPEQCAMQNTQNFPRKKLSCAHCNDNTSYKNDNNFDISTLPKNAKIVLNVAAERTPEWRRGSKSAEGFSKGADSSNTFMSQKMMNPAYIKSQQSSIEGDRNDNIVTPQHVPIRQSPGFGTIIGGGPHDTNDTGNNYGAYNSSRTKEIKTTKSTTLITSTTQYEKEYRYGSPYVSPEKVDRFSRENMPLQTADLHQHRCKLDHHYGKDEHNNVLSTSYNYNANNSSPRGNRNDNSNPDIPGNSLTGHQEDSSIHHEMATTPYSPKSQTNNSSSTESFQNNSLVDKNSNIPLSQTNPRSIDVIDQQNKLHYYEKENAISTPNNNNNNMNYNKEDGIWNLSASQLKERLISDARRKKDHKIDTRPLKEKYEILQQM